MFWWHITSYLVIIWVELISSFYYQSALLHVSLTHFLGLKTLTTSYAQPHLSLKWILNIVICFVINKKNQHFPLFPISLDLKHEFAMLLCFAYIIGTFNGLYWLSWITWLIEFPIQSSQLWSILSYGKSWNHPNFGIKVSIVTCYTFFQFLIVLDFQSDQIFFGDFWNKIQSYSHLKVKFPPFRFLRGFFSTIPRCQRKYHLMLWCWWFITAFIMTLLLLLGHLYAFIGLSMYLFSNDGRKDQHSINDLLVKGLIRIQIFCRC